MPQELQETIEEILQILDSEYGSNRNRYEDARGYIVEGRVLFLELAKDEEEDDMLYLLLDNEKQFFSDR